MLGGEQVLMGAFAQELSALRPGAFLLRLYKQRRWREVLIAAWSRGPNKSLTNKAGNLEKYILYILDCVDHNQLWKILKEMGIPDHLTCFLRNLYAGQQATVRTGHGTTDWLQIGEGGRQGCILSPCLLNLYAEYIMRNAGLDEAQTGVKIAGRNSNDLRYHPYGRTKEPLDKNERGEWKSWLKTQHSEN